MMVGIKIEETKFIPARDASKLSGYDPDYIGQLCRGGKLECKRVGRGWFVNEKSLVSHCQLNGNSKPFKIIEKNPTESTATKIGDVEKIEVFPVTASVAEISRNSLPLVKNEKSVTPVVKQEIAKSESSLEIGSTPLVRQKSSYFKAVPKNKNRSAISGGNFSKLRYAADQISLRAGKLFTGKVLVVPSHDFIHKAVTMLTAIVLVFGAYHFQNSSYVDDGVKALASAFESSENFIADVSRLSSKEIGAGFADVGVSVGDFVKGKAFAIESSLKNKLQFAALTVSFAKDEIFESPLVFAKNTGLALGASVNDVYLAFNETVVKTFLASLNETGSAIQNTAAAVIGDPLLPAKTVAKSFNKTVNGWINDGGRFFASLFNTPSPEIVLRVPPKSKAANPNGLSGYLVVEGPRTVVKTVTERVAYPSVSREEVDAMLTALNSSLRQEIYKLTGSVNGNTVYVNNVYNAVAQSNRIDQLTGITINTSTINDSTLNNPTINGGTWNGGTISGAAFSGSTGDFSGAVTISNTLSAGASFSTSTFSGDVAFDTDSLYIDSINHRIGIGTTSPIAKLDIFGDVILSGADRYLNFGDTSGLAGYGLRDNAGMIEFKNSAGNWTGIGSGSGTGDVNLVYSNSNNFYRLSTTSADLLIGGSSTTSAARLEVIGGGYFSENLGLGTTSPYSKLSVVGETVSAYFTATTTSTSTLPRLSSTGIATDWLCIGGTCNASWPSSASSTLLSDSNTFSGSNIFSGNFSLTGLSAGGLAVNSSGLAYSYSTSTWAFASSTLLADNNTFSGTNVFSNLRLSGTPSSMLASFDASGNLTSTSSPQVAYINATSTTATSTFAGGFSAASSLYALQNGNVGIGTASPGAKLEIYHDSSVSEFRNNIGVDTNFGRFAFYEGSTLGGTLQYIGTNYSTASRRGNFEISAGGSGNVVLGVNDPLIINSLGQVSVFGDAAVTPGRVFRIGKAADAYNGMEITANSTTWLIDNRGSVTTPNNQLMFSSPAGNTFSFTDTGSVGIGTTSPYAKLSVVGEVVGAYFTATTTSTSTLPRLSSTGIATDWLCLTGDSCRTTWPTGSGGSVGGVGWATTTASNESIYFYGTSNVGIGTSSPYAMLSVAGQVVAEKFTATSTTATSTIAGGLVAGGSTGLTVLQNGNVGIATSTPSEKLTVNGNISFNGLSKMSSSADGNISLTNNAGTGFTLLQLGGTTGSFPALRNNGDFIHIVSADNNFYLGLLADALHAIQYVRAPAFQFYDTNWQWIRDDAAAYGSQYNLVTMGGGSGTSRRFTWIDSGTEREVFSSSISDPIASSGNESAFSITPQISQSGTAGYTGLLLNVTENTTGSGNKNLFDVQVGNSSKFLVKNDGSVGIGTTSPYAKLSVVGEVVGEYFTATSTTATSTFAGGFQAGGSTGLYVLQNGAVGVNTTATADYLLSLSGDASTDNSRVLNISQTNDFAEDNYGIYLSNTANSGTVTSGSRTIAGIYQTLTPTVVSGVTSGIAGGPSVHGLNTNVNISNISFIDSDKTSVATVNGNYSSVSGALGTIGDTNSTGSNTLALAGSYNAIDISLPSAALSDDFTSNTYGGFFQNSTIGFSDALLTANSYGISASATGDLVTTGSTAHYGAKLTASGSADTNFGLYLDSSGATTNYGLYSNSGQNYFADNVGIGTTSPYAKLSVVGEVVAEKFTATSTTATSTFAGGLNVGSGGFTYDLSTGITAAASFQTGNMSFETNAGAVSWVDMPVTSGAPSGTVESYSAQINGNSIFTIYSQSNGGGDITKVRAVVGTSTATVLDSTNIPYGSFLVSDGALCVDNGTGNTCATSARTRGFIYAEGSSVAGLDIAEMYSASSTSVSAGDIVMADPENPKGVKKYSLAGAGTSTPAILGVVSTAPGVILGGFSDDVDTGVPIALSGRVPVKVNLENGPIAIGERVAPSATSGVASKAVRSGETIGIALEALSATSTDTTITVFIDKRYHFASEDFAIDPLTGNVGIGTTTPAYKLHVVGDVAAQSFINISTRGEKKDIAYLGDTDINNAVSKINGMKLANYRYNNESENSPTHLGLIAEEAPLEVLSADGKGVDLYKLSSLLLAGIQSEDKRIGALETKVAALEALIVAGGGINLASTTAISAITSSPGVLQGIVDYFSSLGANISQGLARFTKVIASAFTVGSAESPAGITLYDKVTKAPYCFEMIDGSATTTPGACVELTNNLPPTTDNTTTTPEQISGGNLNAQASSSTPPVITLMGNNPAEINIGSSFVDPGATAVDSTGQSIMPDLVSNNVDTSKVGEYQVVWSAHDSALNYATSTRTVNVVNPFIQITPPATTTDNGISGENLNTQAATTTPPIELVEEAETTIPVETAITTTP